MKCELSKRPAVRSNRHCRGATSTLEVIVALTLLLSVLSLSVSLIMRHGHLLTAQRHYRQALDELSNQMDKVTALPADEVPQALKQLSLSPFAVARLSAAKLKADLKPADVGQRITMQLTWNESHEQTVSMTGWIFPQTGPPAKRTGGEP
jgi:hypothetical protein